MSNCPRCDYDLEKALPELLEEDVKEYVRSLLGNRSFSKDYPLYNGEITVTFESIMLTF